MPKVDEKRKIFLYASVWHEREEIVIEDIEDTESEGAITLQVECLFYFLRHCIPSEVVKRTIIKWVKMTM